MNFDELALDDCRGMAAGDLALLANGYLWTAPEADQELDVPKGTVRVWVARDHIQPALTLGRTRYYWSNDLIDRCETRKQDLERDKSGRFKPKILPA